jgi:hypothetical protein
MECKKCSNSLFVVQIIPCCDDCDQNAAYDYDAEEYTLDMKVIDEKELLRDHVVEEGECKMGSAFGAGCYMFSCSKCNNKTNLSVMDGC